MCFFGRSPSYEAPPTPVYIAAPEPAPAPAPSVVAPAPVPSASSPQTTADVRRKKLETLKQGRLATIKTSSQGITTQPLLSTPAAQGKEKLGQ